MTARYLLDTNVVSETLAAAPDANVVARLDRHRTELAIGAPVWHELLFGARRLAPGKRRDLIERFLDDVVLRTLPILPYDAAAAGWHAEERARLQGHGLRPPFVDGQIAAVARVNGLVLVTRDESVFAPFRDLEVENWFAPSGRRGARRPSPRTRQRRRSKS